MASVKRDGDVFLLDLGEGDIRFNEESVSSIERCLDEIEAAAPCAIVTVASGKIWCNGLDLQWLGTQGQDAPKFVSRLQELLARVLELGVPSVAAIQGHVFAAGAMFALAHDERVMRADRGYFCLPEVDIRIPFTAGMSALIAARLPPQTAHQAMALGRRFGGEAALEAGIVQAAVGEEHVRDNALDRAVELASKDPQTLRAIKARLYQSTLAALRGPLEVGGRLGID
ncbi:MAG: enoyl-CoA hydratase-related protein [Solirubrobacteraceae bacterium]